MSNDQNYSKKKLVEQGCYVVANKNEGVNFVAYDIFSCIAVVIVNEKKTALLLIDLAMNAEKILLILQNEFDPNEKLTVYLLIGSGDHQIIQENFKKIEAVMEHFADKISFSVVNNQDLYDKDFCKSFLYDVDENQFKKISDERIGNKIY